MIRGALSGLYGWLRERSPRLLSRPRNRLHLALLAGVPVVALSLVVALTWLFSFSGIGDGPSTAARALDAAVSPTPRSTPTPRPAASPTALPTATSEAPLEAASSDPQAAGSSEAGHGSQGPAAESGMRMVIPKIGVNAPVTVRVMGSDGVMGPPNGRFDVVWYDFSAFPGLGGYPGTSGNAVFSGHVDYHPHYEAVFWDLRLLAPGDIIEVYLPDGSVARYAVQWAQTISPESDFSSYCRDTGESAITIVTCQGTFNAATRQYDQRLVVRGALVR